MEPRAVMAEPIIDERVIKACQKGDRETAAHYDGLRRYKDTVAWTDRNEAQSCETFAGGQGAKN